MGARIPGIETPPPPASNTPGSIFWSIVGILVSGIAGGVCGWGLTAALGLSGVPAAIVGAIVGMVVATGVWILLTVVLRKLGMLR